MKIETKYPIGHTVTLRHDREKTPRMITGVSIRGTDSKTHSYNLLSGTVDSWHYEFEMDEIDSERNKAGYIK